LGIGSGAASKCAERRRVQPVPRNYQGREIRAFAPGGHLGRTTLRRAQGRRGTGTSKAARDGGSASRARRVRARARAGRLDRAFSPFCGTPCGACPPSGRQRVTCVTMALSYNRGCTIALWLRRSLSKRKAPTASSRFQAAGLRRLIRHGPGLIILADYDAATLVT
jgi:hypothetical protein